MSPIFVKRYGSSKKEVKSNKLYVAENDNVVEGTPQNTMYDDTRERHAPLNDTKDVTIRRSI